MDDAGADASGGDVAGDGVVGHVGEDSEKRTNVHMGGDWSGGGRGVVVSLDCQWVLYVQYFVWVDVAKEGEARYIRRHLDTREAV